MDESRDGSTPARLAAGTRARGAARANLAGAFGMVLCTYGAPGSVLLTLFLQDCLHADKWQIGLVMTMTFLGPTFEPVGAYLAERFRWRRWLFMTAFLGNRLPFFAFTLVPFLAHGEAGRHHAIVLVLILVALTRVPCHLGNPAWWSWMADLVPERRRGRFFGSRTQATSAVAALSFVAAMAFLHLLGGMHNPALVSALFAVGAACGVIDILLYWNVPEPARCGTRLRESLRTSLAHLAAPFRIPEYRSLILGMGLWSFSANLVMPFVPVYQFGERIAGTRLGLGMSWKALALLNVSASLAGMISSRWWARGADRWGPRRLLILGSGYLFVNLCYLLIGRGRLTGLVVVVAAISGGLNAAWTVGTNQLVLGLAPQRRRSFFIAAFNATNGWLMAGGPLLGGLLADWVPVTSFWLPCGLRVCYFHLLLALSTAGGAVALSLLLRSPALRHHTPAQRAEAVETHEDVREYATA